MIVIDRGTNLQSSKVIDSEGSNYEFDMLDNEGLEVVSSKSLNNNIDVIAIVTF